MFGDIALLIVECAPNELGLRKRAFLRALPGALRRLPALMSTYSAYSMYSRTFFLAMSFSLIAVAVVLCIVVARELCRSPAISKSFLPFPFFLLLPGEPAKETLRLLRLSVLLVDAWDSSGLKVARRSALAAAVTFSTCDLAAFEAY